MAGSEKGSPGGRDAAGDEQMGAQGDIDTIEGLLDQIETENKDRDQVSVGAVLDAVGSRSFGPMLLVPGLIAFSPLSGIPGVPTLVGTMVFLISGQLLIGRSAFWLPRFVLRRSIARPRFEQAIRVLRKPARFVDRFLKRRLTFLVEGVATYMIAALSLMLSLVAPLMELLPFVISGVGVVLSCFGFGLLSRDGVLVLIGLVLAAAIAVAVGAGFAAA